MARHVHKPTRDDTTGGLRKSSLLNCEGEDAQKTTLVAHRSSVQGSSLANSDEEPVHQFERTVAAELEALHGRILTAYKHQLANMLKGSAFPEIVRHSVLSAVEGSTEVSREPARSSAYSMPRSTGDRNMNAGRVSQFSTASDFWGHQASKLRTPQRLIIGADSMIGEVRAMRKVVEASITVNSSISSRGEAAGCLTGFIGHRYFSNFVTCIIVINALTIAMQTEWRAQNVGRLEPAMFALVDMCCNAIFIIELGLNLLVYRRSYFVGKAWKWNAFDCVVVIFALAEMLMMQLGGGVSIPGATILRVLRLMRIVRTVRVLQVAPVFRELRMMVHSIMNCVMAFSWLILLLAFVMFVCSVFITHGITDQKEHSHKQGLPYDEDTMWLDDHFGSLAKSFYSMFKVVSDGQGWGIYCDHLLRTSVVAAFVLMAYVAFTTFAILNIVTGIFVNFSMKAAENDSDTMALEYADTQEKLIKGFCTVFNNADSTGAGYLTFHDFVAHIGDPAVRAYLKFLHLDVELFPPEKIFKLLDFDGDGQIDLKEFVTGLSKFRGNARALDMAALHSDMVKVHSDMVKVHRRIDASLRKYTINGSETTGHGGHVLKPQLVIL